MLTSQSNAMAGAGEGPMADGIERILCISTYEKGQDFLRQCADMGVRATLITLDKHKNGDWPRESLEDIVTISETLNARADYEHGLLDVAGAQLRPHCGAG